MVSPEYLLQIAEGAEDLAELLHQDIMRKVIERIMIRLDRGDDYYLTAVDKWQLETLQEAGYLMEDIQKEIVKKTPLMKREIKEAFEDAGVTAINNDNAIYKAAGLPVLPIEQSPALIAILERNFAATLGDMENFTRTMPEAAHDLYVRECDKAYYKVASGAESWSQAVKEAVETISKVGVTVTYPSGHTDTIETATLRAVRTGVAQATGQITLKRMEEMDWDIILTSAHLGARYGDGGNNHTNHYWWQGKFYSRTGKDKRFPNFNVCGLGDVQGIHGANCRHSIMPGDGEHNPFEKFDNEENKKAYDLSQRQRTLERRIRRTKREFLGYKTGVDNAKTEEEKEEQKKLYERTARLLAKQNKAYNKFCEENDLKRRAERIAIAQWGRKQAAAARAAARKKPTYSD